MTDDVERKCVVCETPIAASAHATRILCHNKACSDMRKKTIRMVKQAKARVLAGPRLCQSCLEIGVETNIDHLHPTHKHCLGPLCTPSERMRRKRPGWSLDRSCLFCGDRLPHSTRVNRNWCVNPVCVKKNERFKQGKPLVRPTEIRCQVHNCKVMLPVHPKGQIPKRCEYHRKLHHAKYLRKLRAKKNGMKTSWSKCKVKGCKRKVRLGKYAGAGAKHDLCSKHYKTRHEGYYYYDCEDCGKKFKVTDFKGGFKRKRCVPCADEHFKTSRHAPIHPSGKNLHERQMEHWLDWAWMNCMSPRYYVVETQRGLGKKTDGTSPRHAHRGKHEQQRGMTTANVFKKVKGEKRPENPRRIQTQVSYHNLKNMEHDDLPQRPLKDNIGAIAMHTLFADWRELIGRREGPTSRDLTGPETKGRAGRVTVEILDCITSFKDLLEFMEERSVLPPRHDDADMPVRFKESRYATEEDGRVMLDPVFNKLHGLDEEE